MLHTLIGRQAVVGVTFARTRSLGFTPATRFGRKGLLQKLQKVEELGFIHRTAFQSWEKQCALANVGIVPII